MISATTTQAELATLPDAALYPYIPHRRLAEVPGLETEVSVRLWCRERGINRRDLQPMLEGRRKPKPGAKRHAKRGSTSPATPATGGTPAGRTEHEHPGGQ